MNQARPKRLRLKVELDEALGGATPPPRRTWLAVPRRLRRIGELAAHIVDALSLRCAHGARVTLDGFDLPSNGTVSALLRENDHLVVSPAPAPIAAPTGEVRPVPALPAAAVQPRNEQPAARQPPSRGKRRRDGAEVPPAVVPAAGVAAPCVATPPAAAKSPLPAGRGAFSASPRPAGRGAFGVRAPAAGMRAAAAPTLPAPALPVDAALATSAPAAAARGSWEHAAWADEEWAHEEWADEAADSWRGGPDERERRKQARLAEEEAHWPAPLFAPRHRATQPAAAADHDSLPAYASLPALEGAARPGDTLAFKLVRLDDSWAPVTSDWRVARVAARDAGTGMLTLEHTADHVGVEEEAVLERQQGDLIDPRVVARAPDTWADDADPDADAGAEPAPASDGATGGVAAAASYDKRQTIVRQVEYYFSDKNLRGDGFMRGKISADADGYVALSLILSFNRMRKMNVPIAEVAEALRASEEIELDATWRRVRRRTPYDGA